MLIRHDSTYSRNLNFGIIYFFNLFLLFSAFLGGLFSPHLGFWACVFLLISFFSKYKLVRVGITNFALFMLLFVAVSREIGLTKSDDLLGTYMPILNNFIQYGTFESTGLGIEVGLVVYLDIILNFFKIVDPRIMLFVCVSFTLFFYSIWLNRFFIKEVDNEDIGLAIAVSLAFMQVGLLTQTLRQEMATPFLLVSMFLWDKKKVSAFIILLIATCMHSSSLIIFMFYLFFPAVKLKWKVVFFIFVFCFSLSISLYPGKIINALNILHLSFISKKIQYYLTARESDAGGIIAAGKFYLLIIIIMIGNNFFFKSRVKEITGTTKGLYDFCFWGSICNLTFVTLPNASRFFLVIPGFLMYFVFLPFYKKYPAFFTFLLCSYIMVSIFFPQRLIGGGMPGFQLWNSYSWYDFTPFYYITRLFNL